MLYLGAQVVFKTTDGGRNWEAISPDLSRETYELPASVASYRDAAKQQATRRGVVYSVGPSRLNVNVTLGRHRRWPDPRHARRRQDLEERHAARP